MVLRHFATCLGEGHGNKEEHSSDSISKFPAHNHSLHLLSCLGRHTELYLQYHIQDFNLSSSNL